MRVLLVFPNRTSWFGESPLGILYLSAVLEKNGHGTDLFDLTSYPTYSKEDFIYTKKENAVAKDFKKKIETFKPDLIGFSVISTNYNLAITLSNAVKNNFEIPIVFGGPHPTVDPEATISERSVDFICVGEGELALLELVNKMADGEDLSDVKNIWMKKNGRIIRNPVRPLIQDLDILPYPNRDLLDSRYLTNETVGANFLTSRGCPYRCTYCINKYLQDLYTGGRFVRFRNIDAVVDEIKHTVKRYQIQKITFSDETFTINKKRTIDFCRRYEEEIGLPFICLARADEICKAGEELLDALKQAGCIEVHIGIESGNKCLREKVLKRNMTNETIVRSFKLAKESGLRTGSFNMIGVPLETSKTVKDTIKINRIVSPDFILCTLYMPLKGTELEKLCEKSGWIKRPVEELHEYYYDTVLELPSVSSKELIAYQRFFNLYVRLPSYLDSFTDLVRYFYMTIPSKRLRNIIDFGIGTYLTDHQPPKNITIFPFIIKTILTYAGILKSAST